MPAAPGVKGIHLLTVLPRDQIPLSLPTATASSHCCGAAAQLVERVRNPDSSNFGSKHLHVGFADPLTEICRQPGAVVAGVPGGVRPASEAKELSRPMRPPSSTGGLRFHSSPARAGG